MEIVLFEDAAWRRLLPFTWLRPVYDLRVGALTIRERWEALLGEEHVWLSGRPDLAPVRAETYGDRAGQPVGPGRAVWINGA